MHMQVMVGGEKINLSGRLTMVLEKREDNWLIVHLHFSMPSADQKTGQSYPL
ncbi:MAG: nuclear transport factor 2 family protein, partial [Methanobacterium sp.]|nr:nuclear transport factor 2 family protein [Methanobacterium sp.]